MKTPRILATTIAALLLNSPLFAATFTWDGGSIVDSNISTAANWNPDGAPPSDLTNTNLIFAGSVRLTPNVSAAYSANSITFNNTAGAFTIGGVALNVGAGGIVNNDADTMTFMNFVSFSGVANSTINAASGGLTFNNAVIGATGTTTIDGAGTTTFGSIGSGGTVTKQGAGTMNWSASASPNQFSFNINAGTVNTVADGTTDLFNAGGGVAVNNTAIFNINENLTIDTVSLSRASTAAMTLAAGKTLRLQNGADANITGTFSNTTASTITVTGVGSTFTTTSTLTLGGGSTTSILAGGNLSSSSTLSVATSGNGTVTVDGSGSGLASGPLAIGQNGATGSVTFSNTSTGTLNSINVDNSGVGGTSGTLNIQSGASVTGTSLLMATILAANTGTVTINGTNSALTVSGSGTTTMGASSTNTAALNVQSGGTFNSGTGLTTVNATGTIAITGGTFNTNGNMTLNGGGLTRDASGVFDLAAGKTFTVQGGGDVSITGNHSFVNALTLNIAGAGSTFQMNGGGSDLTFSGAMTGNVTAGGSVSIGGALTVGSTNPGTLTVDGSASILTVGNFISLGVGSGGNGTLNVLGGANAMAGDIQLANGSSTGTGNILVSGAGSTLTQTGAAALAIGNAAAVQARLRVEAGGVFTSGTGVTTMNGPGVIELGGGTYFAKGDLVMGTNSQLIMSAGFFSLAAGRTLTIQTGADAISTAPGGGWGIGSGNVVVVGAGSTFQAIGDFGEIDISYGGVLSVQNGAIVSAATGVNVGGYSGYAMCTMTVTGAGSSVSASSGLSHWGHFTDANVTFSEGGTGSYTGLSVAEFGNTTTVAQILSGADVTNSGSLALGEWVGATTSGTITVNGIGSTWTQTGASTVSIGAASLSTAILNVQNGGTFTSGTGSFTVNPTGVVNIDGGTLTLNGPITNNGTFNFNAGALSIVDNFTIGSGGLLGTNLTLDASRRFATTATTTIDTFQTLTLNGGSFSTGALVNNGTLDFQKGTLGITGVGGFNIGAGALGANVTLGTGANLQVMNTATIASGATLTMNGGSFTAGALNNTGTLRANLGVANVGAVTNNSGGRIFVGDTLNASGAWTNAAGSQVTLEHSGLVNGAGAITNSGLVTGDGTIAKSLTNASGGEVRGEFGKTLYFTGATGANAGRLNLLGGTLQFTQQFTNSATGQINGQGALYFPTTPVPSNGSPTAGLMNAGNINLTGGDSQIYGTVQMQAGSRLIVSGGATASFFDVFRHSGTEVRASAGSNIVFFGEVRGAGSFTGTGTTYFEGGYSPGNSPALITHGGNVVFGTFNTLTMELGGTARGAQYDALDVAGRLTFDGTLALSTIGGFVPTVGDRFTITTFGIRSGTFAGITGQMPAPGVFLSEIYRDNDLILLATAPGEKTWGIDASGNASVGGNWIGGVAPGGVGDSATFSTIITAPRIVTLDSDTQVGSLKFDSPISYTIAGPNTLTLQATGGNAATINVSSAHGNGSHAISAPITLSSDLNIVQNSSGTLRLTGPLNDSAARAIIKSGSGTAEIAAQPTLGASTVVNVNSGTFRFATSSGSPMLGTGVQVNVSGTATLELAGSVSALSSGSNRVNVVNNSSASAGVLVSGSNQQVDGIDGSGTTQVNAGSDLTANHIIQGMLIIDGIDGSPALVTIDASDAAGNPLGQPNGLALARSLTPNDPFGADGVSFASLGVGDRSELAALSPSNSVVGGNPPSVPEPSALLLVLVAITGLAGPRIALWCRTRQNDFDTNWKPTRAQPRRTE